MDLTSVYRDVIAVQTDAPGDLVNEEMRDEVRDLARRSTPADNLRRIDAIFTAREQMMEFNTNLLISLEGMMVALRIR
jgi:DNA polymerase-3 subunit delta'